MRKTTLYLEESEAAALRRLAAETGRSQAELIRQAIEQLIAPGPSRTFHSMGRGSSSGDASAPRWRSEDLYRKVMGRD
jgi:ribbon-helix-helix CopG family protein